MCPAAQDVLFEPGTYTCDSRHQNLIAFQFELGLLRRVLHAAGANDAESLEVGRPDMPSLLNLMLWMCVMMLLPPHYAFHPAVT